VTLRQLGVSDVNMEEGSLRCDANVSIRPAGEAGLGTKTELKNMNSFRFLERGVDAEIARQEEIVRSGGAVTQETLHFDPRTGALSPLRSKEEAHDYRYFPEPDLVPVAPTEEMLERARSALPELPAQRAERFESLGLPSEAARLLAFRSELGDFFEAAVAADGSDPKLIANWVTGELVAKVGDDDPAATKLEPAALAKLVGMVAGGDVAGSAAKEVLAKLVSDGGDPAAIVEAESLGRAGGDELAEIVERAMADNADAVQKVREGNDKAIGAIMGPVMRETKGTADGAEVQRLILERL
jgi:aspartyl-tRNA(Asn)/glutamyl-tRNA(Gln) amidotransferase subunit B